MLFATLLFIIYLFLVAWFTPSTNSKQLSSPTYPEQVFQIIDEIESNNDSDQLEENEESTLTIDYSEDIDAKRLAELQSCKDFIIHEPWTDEDLSTEKNTSEIDILSMTLSELKKCASKLKTAGYFSGKINQKGMNKKRLLDKIQSALNNHPDAAKLLA